MSTGNRPPKEAGQQATVNQQIVDPAQVEKNAYRQLAQVQQAISLLADIIDALRKQIEKTEEEKKAAETKAGTA